MRRWPSWVSGGKDSQAAAIAAIRYLDRVGHAGPRILIHSDLGSVEWNDSLPVCERLAAHLRIDLVTVRRAAGGLMERWNARWRSSVRRYANLETVTLVLPWSTPSMRFCTSEMKTKLIAAELKRRFKGQPFVNITGIRRQESAARAHGTMAAEDASGRFWTWRLISDWSLEQAFQSVADEGLATHEGYSRGMSRISCKFCIMSSEEDLTTAAAAPEARDIYREIVGLEIASTFSFQGYRWLGDIAPSVLTEAQRRGLAEAKRRAAARIAAEKQITKGMLYVKGWPTRMLTDAEAAVLAIVRKTVSGAVGFEVDHLDVPAIHRRYAALIAAQTGRLAH